MQLPGSISEMITVLTWIFSTTTGFMALRRASINPQDCEHSSKFSTPHVAVRGPVCIVYAIIALLGTIAISISYQKNFNSESIEKGETKNSSNGNNSGSLITGANIDKNGETPNSLHTVDIYKEPISIINGTVLVKRLSDNSTTLKIQGITGISESKSGLFKNDIEQLEVGKRLYFQTEDRKTYGLNVIHVDSVRISFEYFKVQSQPQRRVAKTQTQTASPIVPVIIIKADTVITQNNH